jgi:type I site-specific restriction endonuclease
MSDELFNGNIAVNLSLAEAIVKGILPMPKYVSALYTFEDEVSNLKDKVNKSHNSDEEKEELLKQIDIMKNKLNKSKGIPNILRKHLISNNGKFIVFCKNKEHLNEMKNTVVDWFRNANIGNKIDTYTVYTGYENTDAEFESFRDNKNADNLKLLFSIEMLNEGIHVEDIDGVILLRPTTSPIIYYQQIGRSIDAGSYKEPMIFDFVNNFDNIGAKRFIEDLEKFRQNVIYARKEYQGKKDNDIPEFIVYDEVLEVKDMFNSIEERLQDSWDIMYNQLCKFYSTFNHCDVPQKYENQKLGYWTSTQRQYYKKHKLNNMQIEKLNKINFNWNASNDNWEDMYNLCLQFRNENGDINLIGRNIIYNDVNLGRWFSAQKTKYKKGILLKERALKLKEFGIDLDVNEERWINMFNKLIEFKKANNTTLVSREYVTKDGYKLGNWVGTQQQFFKNDYI